MLYVYIYIYMHLYVADGHARGALDLDLLQRRRRGAMHGQALLAFTTVSFIISNRKILN